MAREVRRFDVVVPAGTLASAPLVAPLTFPPRSVASVSLRIPPGPNGLVGFALAMAETRIIPRDSGAWITADDETIDLPVYGMPDSGAWELIAYNTGVYDHTIYVTFLLDPVVSGATMAPFAPLSVNR